MYQVKADKSRNLLEIAFSGEVDAAAAKQCVEQVERLLGGLEKGFTLLNDLSGLENMELDCAPLLADSMELCKKAGVARIVRVIPDPKKDIGLNILSRFHYPPRIQIVTCETLDEAMKLLA